MSGETSQKSYEDQREPAWNFVGPERRPTIQKDEKIDNVPSEMIKLSEMTLIQSLLILETNPNDTIVLNMSQIGFVSGLLLF